MSLTLSDLEDKRSQLSVTPNPYMRELFYQLLGMKEEKIGKFKEALNDFKKAKAIANSQHELASELGASIAIAEIGLAGAISLKEWLPDTENEIATQRAQLSVAPGLMGRLNMLAIETAVRNPKTVLAEKVAEWLSTARQCEKKIISEGRKFKEFPRGEPDFYSAVLGDQKNLASAKDSLILALAQLKWAGNAPGMSYNSNQQRRMFDLIEKNKGVIPDPVLETVTEKFAEADTDREPDVVFKKYLCMARIQQHLKNQKQVEANIQKAIQFAHAKSEPVLEATGIHASLDLIPMSTRRKCEVASAALQVVLKGAPHDLNALSGSYAILANALIQEGDLHGGTQNLEKAIAISLRQGTNLQGVSKFAWYDLILKFVVAAAWTAHRSSDMISEDRYVALAQRLLQESEKETFSLSEHESLRKVNLFVSQIKQNIQPKIGYIY